MTLCCFVYVWNLETKVHNWTLVLVYDKMARMEAYRFDLFSKEK